ncbi:hypothetical protein D3C81_2211280 [compost metagenome]
MAGELQQIFRQRFIAEDRRAADAECLAKGDDQHLRAYTLLPATASPLLATNTNPVRIIHHQPGTYLLR